MTMQALDHLRVLDLSAWQAGPTVTAILGDFGADILKIEAPGRLDGWRGGAGLLNDKAYERNPIWNAVNRNKRGLSLDLKSETGRALFLRLVKEADIVVENYTPRVMENFNLHYDVLRAANERIIMIALSGFGQTGPWRDYSAFAFPTEEVSGITYLNGRPGGPPMLIGSSVTDALAGAMGTFALLAALWKREQTGLGDYIDLSQVEALTTYLAPQLIEAQITGRTSERRGNERAGLAPHGLFPCQPAGAWVAIAVRSEDEWQALCAAMGSDELAADAVLATATGREANRDRVRAAVTAWTSTRDGGIIVAELQARGVPSAVAATATDLLNDEQLWARGFYQVLDRPETGAHPYPGAFVRLARTPARFNRPAPSYGEHTGEILRDLLGLSAADIAALEEAGVTSKVPGPQDWR